MASGDTIAGDILFRRKDRSDNQVKVVGRLSTSETDTFSFNDPTGKTFINSRGMSRVADDAPPNARNINAPEAIFEQGEELQIVFVPGETTTNDLDVDGDQSQLTLRVVSKDLNTGIANAETRSLGNNEISTDPGVANGSEVTWYRETVGNKIRLAVAGLFEAAPSEA